MAKKSTPPRVSASPRESEKEDCQSGLLPKLRFPEFLDELAWKVSSLGNLATFAAGGTPSKDAPEYWNGHIPWISASSMYDTNLCDSKHKVTSEAIGNGTRIAKAGSLLILTRGSMLYNRVPMGIASIDVAFNQDVRALMVDSEVDTAFLMNQLISQESRIPIHDTGIGAGKIDTDDLRRFFVAIPSLPEQRKIASCLSTLDELIGSQGRKVAALRTHKKGLMQQLFPREGETQPRLRFPEFQNAGDWEDIELGLKASKVGSGITPTGGDKNYKQAGRPFVRSQNVGWGILLLDDVAYIDEETHRSFDSTEIEVRDVLLNITGASIGRSAVADERIVGGNVNQHVCIIRTNSDELNPFFLNQYLICQRGQMQIDSFQAGGNRQGLNFAQIRSFAIPLPPSPDEQQRIALCLSSLEDLLTAETQKLEALKTHKRGLMQQLFPSPEEAS